MPFMRSYVGRLLTTLLGRRRPHPLAFPLSRLAASGPLRSVLKYGFPPEVSSLVDKFAMWWAYAEGISDWARKQVAVP